MKRTIIDDKHGFSKHHAELRQTYAEIDAKHHKSKLSADFKKIVNQDSYGVQRKEIK